MPNPNGNRTRCRECGGLAGKDGWCRNHRPQWKSNRKPVGMYKKTGLFGNNKMTDKYRARKDTYTITEDWYGRND